MKESGINYFVNNLGPAFDTGDFRIFYTFEDGAGTQVSSIPSGQSQFSGVISSVGDFWSSPGSGFFSGNSVAVSNASGLYSAFFTHLFSFRKAFPAGAILLSNLNGHSGYSIGLTDSNKLYFESNNDTPIVTSSTINLSSQNLVAVTYGYNSLMFGYYDFNSQSFQTENFNYPIGTLRSDNWTLGPQFTGYIDYYLYFSTIYGPQFLNQIASGFYNVPTGTTVTIETVCSQTTTGFINVPFYVTGVTGYTVVNTGPTGAGFFTGAFSTGTTTVALTGIISSGLQPSGLTGLLCANYTGAISTAFQTNSGYASGFGMEKVLSLRYVSTTDVLKVSHTQLFNAWFNKVPVTLVSGYQLDSSDYSTGQLNIFYNGLLQNSTDFTLSGEYLFVSGASVPDIIIFDSHSGNRITTTSGGVISYTGQEIYYNGLNLVSGLDFTVQAGLLYLTGINTGFTGIITASPIGLSYSTGNSPFFTFGPFARDTTNLYFNGLRQQNSVDYVEGAIHDYLSGNSFNENGNTMIYDNNGNYWE